MNESGGKIYGQNICSVGVYHNLEHGKREEKKENSTEDPLSVEMLVIACRGFLFFQGWNVEDENRLL